MNNGATPGPAPGAAAVPSGPLRPFAEIVKDAKVLPGYFNVWQKDEKVWLEIDPDQLNEPFFMTVNLSRGLGERMLFAGLMGGEYGVGGYYLAEMRRVGNTLQLIARNTQFTATPGSPEERAVRNAFSDSLLSAAPVVSLPHPERKSILVDANALLLADIPRGSHVIERAYRNVYAFDRANSYFADVKSNEDRTTLDVTAHFTQARIPLAPPQGGPFFAPPDVIEDPRSLFLGFLYTFTKLPDEPMRPRLADARIGHFVMSKVDFSNERKASPRTYYVERWRLEKKDPKAAMSEPIKPITFWLDREIPVKYRAPITAGILEWNKAFERIGFKNAIEVKQQPDDADFDTGDALHASIRWMTTATPSFGAIGPSHVDPRTGEILDADIGWDANMTRNLRIFRAEVANNNGGGNAIGYTPMYDERTGELRAGKSQAATNGRACAHFEYAERELGFALAMLEARGELDPESPQAERFVAEYLKDVTMHEVGHALGLRHNFRASTVYTAEQLDDPDFTAKNGISGSVMEYSPINLGLRKGKQGQYFSSTLGPYDYWAIEYAYKPIAPEREAEELATIAARAD
ncbi:MAG TPA: zinc-dependent metalloprotease, partial [Burkholderiaceae bacterium]|nr:zinc-dependent metalloprotease [Burkholderiaceae bacterium]